MLSTLNLSTLYKAFKVLKLIFSLNKLLYIVKNQSTYSIAFHLGRTMTMCTDFHTETPPTQGCTSAAELRPELEQEPPCSYCIVTLDSIFHLKRRLHLL